MKILYFLYQIVVFIPLLIISTIVTAITVALGCAVGDGHF